MEKNSAGFDSSPPRVAVMDIGSNAMRLLVARGGTDGEDGDGGAGVVVEMFARAPLPLGAEVFGGDGTISRLTAARLALTAAGFRAVALGQTPDGWGAFATAALREAGNGRAVAEDLRRKAGVAVRILSGREEAGVVGRYAAMQFPGAAALLCADIGGGTTELSFLRAGRVRAAASFRVGTARADAAKQRGEFSRLQKWLAAKRAAGPEVVVVGGAAMQAAQLCGGLTARRLRAWRNTIARLTPAEMAGRFGLEPDRAASALAATALYEFLLECSGAKELRAAAGGLPQALAAELLRAEMKKRGRRRGKAGGAGK